MIAVAPFATDIMIPYGRQDVTDADIAAVVAVLRSDFLTQGPVAPRFEAAIAQYCGVGHAVAVNSATSALHIACMALGLGPGDWLWTSPITFVASANCGLYCGAKVDFVDIDPRTYNLCPKALAAKLELAEREGRLPKVVVPVHLAGQPCDMRAIHGLGQRYGFRVIEDASHAIGGKYLGEPIGRCSYSDITVFSFHPVKIITSAEGGMAVTQDAELAERMQLFRSHGITRDPERMTHAPDGDWYYQQVSLGYNYRLTEMQAALGLSQAERIDEYVAQRHMISRYYEVELGGLPILSQEPNPDGYSGLHLYIVQIDSSRTTLERAECFKLLRKADVGVNVHYIPVHLQPYFKSLGFRSGDFPSAESYYRDALSLPMYPTMNSSQLRAVVERVRKALIR